MANLKELKINGIDIIDIIYPIGSIYLTINSQNPSEIIGGEWELWGEGKTIVGVDTSQTEFDYVEKTGGEKNHQLSIPEIPSHTHKLEPNGNAHSFSWGANKGDVYANIDAVGGASPSGTNRLYTHNGEWNQTVASGSTQPHNNLQPYITCYMWKRIS